MPKIEINFTEKNGQITSTASFDKDLNVASLLGSLANIHDSLKEKLDQTSMDPATRLKLKISDIALTALSGQNPQTKASPLDIEKPNIQKTKPKIKCNI